jgi:hypothetical protein
VLTSYVNVYGELYFVCYFVILILCVVFFGKYGNGKEV